MRSPVGWKLLLRTDNLNGGGVKHSKEGLKPRHPVKEALPGSYEGSLT
jgi:hypothetical protein